MKANLLLLMLFLLTSMLYAQQDEYQKAKESKTIEAYDEFLKAFPTSEYAEEISFLKVKKIGKDSAYNAFLALYSQTKYRDRIEYEQLLLHEPTLEDFKAFKVKYPDCECKESVQRKINNLEFPVLFAQLIEEISVEKPNFDTLLVHLDRLCDFPPTLVKGEVVGNYKKYIIAIERRLKENKGATPFFYKSMELNYHVNQAICTSMMSLMMNEYIKVDIFENVNSTNSLLEPFYACIIADTNSESRYSGLYSLNRILARNNIKVSKKWTNGEQVSGREVMLLSVPLKLDQINEVVTKLKKEKLDEKSAELLKKIEEKLNS